MTKLDALAARLRALDGLVTDVRVRPDIVLCAFGSEDTLALAERLRADLDAEVALMVAADRRADGAGFEVHYVFTQPRQHWVLDAATQVAPGAPTIRSLASFHYPASRFEREIHDLFGITAVGHPDPRPLVRHGFWPDDYFPLRKDAVLPSFVDDGRPFPFQQVDGEGVYEIPVGPVHAGIIEPGHFRFSVVGETIIDMKSRLYFTHKGTEKLFEGRAPEDGVALAERISGDTTIGHALAYCQALEAASGVDVPPRARHLRTILLELERLYNHVGDFGMIANDTGFAAAHAHCFRIRERLLRVNGRLTGNRLLRGALVPGGVRCDVGDEMDIAGEVAAAVEDFDEVVALSLSNTLLLDRLEGTGRLTERTARDHGVLGFVARASGIDADMRRDHPFAAYGELAFTVPVLDAGDVKARALIRVEEAHQSAAIIRQALERLPSGPLTARLGRLRAFEPAVGMVEGWRGGVIHWVMAGADGRLSRVKVLDPSFLNWRALSYALLKNIVPDFPLCNKSFNQSYSGNDL